MAEARGLRSHFGHLGPTGDRPAGRSAQSVVADVRHHHERWRGPRLMSHVVQFTGTPSGTERRQNYATYRW